MRRDIESQLPNWKRKKNRMPLIIRGARQVGKTYIMKKFGESHFSKTAYFNFDEQTELKQFFETNKDVDRVIESLSLISGVKIERDTLLILDEIQECPEALNTLKYFAEKKPEIPVICAGSLLGILLNSGHSFPVGKVEFLDMYPMTFREVMPYWGEKGSRFFEQLGSIESVPDLFYNDLLDHFKKYLITGGMPAIVRELNESKSFESCDQMLGNLILSFKGDFAKHPVMSETAKIGNVFESLPAQLARENKKFVYRLIRSGARARAYEDAIQWLINSGMAHKIKLNTKPGIPLAAYDDLNAFKLYALDVGVIRKLAGLSPTAYTEGTRLFTEFKGAVIENFILQSLVAQFKELPRYWSSGNKAEIDFLIQYNNHIIPVEVKSDENVKSRSLSLYHKKYNPPLRIRFSLKNLHYEDGLLNIPHFLVDFTSLFVKQIL